MGRLDSGFILRIGKELPKPVRERLRTAYIAFLPIRHYSLHGHVYRTLFIRRYLKNNKIAKLQVGCGANLLNGWLNADIISGDIYLNAKRIMPFKANTFDFIFCEHLIEHLSKESELKFLKECHRVLKMRGVIRIATPDLEKIIDLYYDRNKYMKRQELIEMYGKGAHIQPCELFNDYMHNWGHKFIYDKNMIARVLATVGFKDIIFCDYKKSSYSELNDLERHIEEYRSLNLAETFIVECRK